MIELAIMSRAHNLAHKKHPTGYTLEQLREAREELIHPRPDYEAVVKELLRLCEEETDLDVEPLHPEEIFLRELIQKHTPERNPMSIIKLLPRFLRRFNASHRAHEAITDALKEDLQNRDATLVDLIMRRKRNSDPSLEHIKDITFSCPQCDKDVADAVKSAFRHHGPYRDMTYGFTCCPHCNCEIYINDHARGADGKESTQIKRRKRPSC